MLLKLLYTKKRGKPDSKPDQTYQIIVCRSYRKKTTEKKMVEHFPQNLLPPSRPVLPKCHKANSSKSSRLIWKNVRL